MKTKSIAMLAMSGLLATSIAYVTPAVAEEAGSSMPMEQMLADNSNGATMQAPADEATPAIPGSEPAPSDSGANNGGSTDAGNTGGSSTDQGTPDTATGDDDY